MTLIPLLPVDPADRNDFRNYRSIIAASRDLGISRRTIYNWMLAGKITYKVMPSGRRMVFKGDLLAEIGLSHSPAKFGPGVPGVS